MKAQIFAAGTAAIALALSGCISAIGGNCSRDPLTGRIVCQGEYIPAPPPPPVGPIGERG